MAHRGFRGSSTALAALIATVALLLAVGCSSGKEKKKKKKKKNLPPAQVDLPDPPPASELKIPEKNPDGSFRVEGLIAHRGKHFGEKVEIKGIISYLSPDCDPTEAKKKGKECPQPYMYIQDGEEAERKLMVVGYDQEFIEDNEIKSARQIKEEDEDAELKKHVFKGTYKKLAQGFVATEQGLLLLDKVDDMNVIEEEDQQ